MMSSPHQIIVVAEAMHRQVLGVKPAGKDSCLCGAEFNKLNSHLPLFPPPVAESADPTQLSANEWLDLLKFEVPNSWQTAIIPQNVDPLQYAAAEFVVFCE
jgi:hypothetical protein